MNIPLNYLDKFTVNSMGTLFGPNWENLKIKCCPLCGKVLKQPLSKKIYFCPSKKHKGFVIRSEKLNGND